MTYFLLLINRPAIVISVPAAPIRVIGSLRKKNAKIVVITGII